jgi:hypothetical protein
MEQCQEMPVFRYFVYVGGALLALLLGANVLLPEAPGVDTLASSADTPVIRIHSDRKWPDPVVFDTNQAPIAPPPVVVARAEAAAAASPITLASPKARVREAFAQLPLSALAPAEAKKPEVRRQPKHKLARARPAQPTQQPMLVAQQPHFGFFGNTW